MSDDQTKTDIDKIFKDRKLSIKEQIEALETMHQQVRAEQRAGTESSMVVDDDIGENLRLLEIAIKELHASPDSPEDMGAATL